MDRPRSIRSPALRQLQPLAFARTFFVLPALLSALTFAVATSAEEASAPLTPAEIQSLREGAHFDSLVVRLRAELDRQLADSTSVPREIDDTRRRLTSYERASAMGPADQATLAACFRAYGIAEQTFYDGKYLQGIDILEPQVAVLEQLLGSETWELADHLDLLAVLYTQVGRFDDAVETFERELAIREALGLGGHPDVTITLLNLSTALTSKADYEAGEECIRRALTIRRGITDGPDDTTAGLLTNLAVNLEDQGLREESVATYREALEIYRAVNGDEHRHVALAMHNLASSLYEIGDYTGAEALFRSCLAQRRRLLGPEHPDVAASLSGLGNVLAARGDYAGAVPAHREALAISRARLGDEHPTVTFHLGSLANAIQYLPALDEAEALYRQKLDIERRIYNGEHPRIVISLNNLGFFLIQQDREEEGESLLREAIALNTSIFGRDTSYDAPALNNLGRLLADQGQAEAAIELSRRSLEAQRASHGMLHPNVVKALQNIGRVHSEQAKWAEAESALVEATRVYESVRLRAGLGPARSTVEGSPYPALAATRLAAGRTDAAWPAIERHLGRTLTDLLVAARERPLTPSERASEDSLTRRITLKTRRLSVCRRAARKDSAAEALACVEEVRSDLLATQGELIQFQIRLAAKYPVAAGGAYPLERVQASLSPRSAILGWLDVEMGGREEAWGYVVRNRGPVAWRRLTPPAAEAASEDDATRLKQLLRRSPTSGAVHADRESLTRVAERVFASRLEPLMDALADVSDLHVIASGPMLGVPVEVLVAERYPESPLRVSYVPSATVYAWLQEESRSDVEASATTAFLIGDPPFAEDQLVTNQERRGGSGATGRVRLPMTREEVETVASIFPHATSLLGPAASEAAVGQLADSDGFREFGTIHIATHAVVDDRQPWNSALVLSQVDLPDPLTAAIEGRRLYDGMVTAEEVLREWKLAADLVTLSACETGLGRAAGGEGYLGLAHAFLQAGARSVIVSLWRVDDRSTALLMQRFYRNLYGSEDGSGAEPAMTKAAGLHEAKVWLRSYEDAYGRRPYAHPYYWAPFILIGDPG